MKLSMVDVVAQYKALQQSIDAAVLEVMASGQYIKGKAVKDFEAALKDYLGAEVITCGNGTDALLLALMALNPPKDAEVITVPFTFVATAEVIKLLGLSVRFVDIDERTFNMDVQSLRENITERTWAIIVVHLFGQCADMEAILEIAKQHNLYVIEDAAQALGAKYFFSDGSWAYAGTMGTIGTTSFYPSKNLGGMGDGGAVFTKDKNLADKIRMLANHGQNQRYSYEAIGVNSRLDSIQAAILNAKLPHLDRFNEQRAQLAQRYNQHFATISALQTPYKAPYASHIYHQYTLKVLNGQRDELKAYLQQHGIPSMIYYPKPLHLHKAFSDCTIPEKGLPVSEQLATQVLSLPIYPELTREQQDYVIEHVQKFFQ